MNNPELMKICRTGHDFRELKVIKDRQSGICEKAASRLTNRKRFTSGLDLVYSITFPFCIQSERIRKYWGFAETETPNKGKILG